MRSMVCAALSGMQGGQHQVSRLRRGYRRRDRLQVPHLADEDDVRILTQHVPEGGRESSGVTAHLAAE